MECGVARRCASSAAGGTCIRTVQVGPRGSMQDKGGTEARSRPHDAGKPSWRAGTARQSVFGHGDFVLMIRGGTDHLRSPPASQVRVPAIQGVLGAVKRWRPNGRELGRYIDWYAFPVWSNLHHQKSGWEAGHLRRLVHLPRLAPGPVGRPWWPGRRPYSGIAFHHASWVPESRC